MSIHNLVSSYELDILCLSETWENKDYSVEFKDSSGKWVAENRSRDDGHGGVSVLVKPSNVFVHKRRKDLELPDIEMVVNEITVNTGQTYTLVTVYIPPNKDMEGKMQKLRDVLAGPDFPSLILTGDLNAKSVRWNNVVKNNAGDILEIIMDNNSLICMNDGQQTRRNSPSVIDLFIVHSSLVPKVTKCETLSHEQVRSDHIPVLMQIDIENETKDNVLTEERWIIKKVDGEKWEKITNEKFGSWYLEHRGKQNENMESMYESFMVVFTECMNEAVPKKKIKLGWRRRKPLWWNEEVSEAKQEWNGAKKSFKRRGTPQMFEDLKIKEAAFDQAAELAKSTWVESICTRMNCTTNPTEFWQCFRTLTSYQEDNGGGVLPLRKEDGSYEFDSEQKCNMLEETFFKKTTLGDFDSVFQVNINNKLDSLKEETISNEEDNDNFITSVNRDISQDEITAAIQLLVKGKAPGPDQIYTDLLKTAGEGFIESVWFMFNRSWASGQVPVGWKTATVKFLRKPAKSSYYETKAYRPISLSSSLGKVLEKIITWRLYGFAEVNKILDNDQEGFRRFHNTTQALLRFTQDIYNGFNATENTLAVFIDFEKAYDSVWREGLMVKLHEKGIRGRVWKWILDYLSNRNARCTIQEFKGDVFQTDTGLPQGSVIAPLLFSIFVSDLFEQISSNRVKFADDSTIWRTGSDLGSMLTNMQNDLDKILVWTKKWRMKINAEKTEVCCFTKDSNVLTTAQNINLTINGGIIPYNANPRLLGVFLDEHMTFSRHISEVERRGMRTLSLLQQVKLVEGINTTRLLQLYKSILRPQLEYAAPVWQIANCETLEKVQRKGLAMCLGVAGTAGGASVEVETGVLPLDLRREELSIREAGSILAKPVTENIKTAWNDWKDKQIGSRERYMSPFSKINMQLSDLTSLTSVTLHNIEAECVYEDSLQPTRTSPEYWNTLGSSKSRTPHQAELARDLVTSLIESDSENCILAFTDGSCLQNPGPCGAGACIFVPGQTEHISIKQPVQRHGAILLGELVAILITIQYYIEELSNCYEKIHIFTDCQSAAGILTLGWKETSYKSTIEKIKRMMEVIRKKRQDIQISWSPGHASIAGNEIADALAKQAAMEAELLPETDGEVTTKADIKRGALLACKMKWQRRWDIGETGRTLHKYRPSVDGRRLLDIPNRTMFSTTTQLRTGYCKLNEYMHRVGSSPEPYCSCGDIESAYHYLLECQQYEDIREQCKDKLFWQSGIAEWSLDVLLSVGEVDPWKESRQTILEVLSEYIEGTGRFA